MDTYEYGARKIVILISSKLDAPTVANVVAHLSVSLGAFGGDGLMGRHMLRDADGRDHRGIARYGVIIKTARPNKIGAVIDEARQRPNLFVADYPTAMLVTKHDDELAGALAGLSGPAMEYLGVLLYGDTADVDGISRKYSLWTGRSDQPQAPEAT